MGLDAALESHAQLAKSCQLGMRSLDHPAVAPELVVALDAPTGDAVLNATALEMFAAAMEVASPCRRAGARASAVAGPAVLGRQASRR
jgi:hypothetical protein